RQETPHYRAEDDEEEYLEHVRVGVAVRGGAFGCERGRRRCEDGEQGGCGSRQADGRPTQERRFGVIHTGSFRGASYKRSNVFPPPIVAPTTNYATSFG